MCIPSQVLNVYTISYYSPYVALELDVGKYSHSVFCYNGYCFSDFQFSDITAVMHVMLSVIIGVPDFGLWFGRKLEVKIGLKSAHFTHRSGSVQVVLQYW